MDAKFIIHGTLPGLNEYIGTERAVKGVYRAASLKRRLQEQICAEILSQIPGISFPGPVALSYLWVERNNRRDRDNISFSQKFIQDALMMAKTIPNDGAKNVIGFAHNFAVDKSNPRIEVTIVDGISDSLQPDMLREDVEKILDSPLPDKLFLDGYDTAMRKMKNVRDITTLNYGIDYFSQLVADCVKSEIIRKSLKGE